MTDNPPPMNTIMIPQDQLTAMVQAKSVLAHLCSRAAKDHLPLNSDHTRGAISLLQQIIITGEENPALFMEVFMVKMGTMVAQITDGQPQELMDHLIEAFMQGVQAQMAQPIMAEPKGSA